MKHKEATAAGPKECPGGGGSARGTPMHSTAVRPAGGRPVFPPSEEHAFCANLEPVQSSSSSEGLARAQGLSSEASVESNEVRILSRSPIAGPWLGCLTSPSYFKMRTSITSTCYTCVPRWDVLCPGPGFSDDSECTGSPCGGWGFTKALQSVRALLQIHGSHRRTRTTPVKAQLANKLKVT